MWKEPKADWSKDHKINKQDYNRIKNNLSDLRDAAVRIYPEINVVTLPDKAYNDFPYADEFNQIEDNLETINQRSVNLSVGEKKTYFENAPTIDYQELNRLESATLRIRESLHGQYQAVPALEFIFGGDF